MSADDQVFLDILSSVPNDVKRYTEEVASYIDRHLEKAAGVLRESLSSSQWIPESARPKPRTPPKSFIPASPASTHAQIKNWVSRNKILTTTIIVVAVGGITCHVIKRKTKRKKRRAKRAANGARFEVVVIAGSPTEPITRSISLDLERRGFIVYVVCNTIEEEVMVQNESRPDIKPLMIDIVDPSSARASIERFTTHLQTSHAAFQGARPHHLHLRSVIVIPSLTYPSSPIATLPPSMLSDLLNTRLFNPILTLQTFLPLLTSTPSLKAQYQSGILLPTQTPSVLVLTPSIIPSLSPAFHAPESTIVAALTSFTHVLSAELAPLSIPVTLLQLGTFDFNSFSPKNQLQTLQSQRAETLRWEDGDRQTYGKNFIALSSGSVGAARGCGSLGSMGRGSSLRELNNAVFDAMVDRKRSGTVRVGMGSHVYGFVGSWVPRGLVAWMLGIRRVGDEKEFGGSFQARSDNGSRSTSPGSSGGNSTAGVAGSGLDGSEYISVYGNQDREE